MLHARSFATLKYVCVMIEAGRPAIMAMRGLRDISDTDVMSGSRCLVFAGALFFAICLCFFAQAN